MSGSTSSRSTESAKPRAFGHAGFLARVVSPRRESCLGTGRCSPVGRGTQWGLWPDWAGSLLLLLLACSSCPAPGTPADDDTTPIDDDDSTPADDDDSTPADDDDTTPYHPCPDGVLHQDLGWDDGLLYSFCNYGCRIIDGSIDGDSDPMEEVNFYWCLEEVTGDFWVNGQGHPVEEFHLPALREVGGELNITFARGPEHVELPALRSVGEAVSISDNPLSEDSRLAVLDLPALEHAGGLVAASFALRRLEVPLLQELGRPSWGPRSSSRP